VLPHCRGGHRAPARNLHIQARALGLAIQALQHGLFQSFHAARGQDRLEILAVALRFHFPRGHGAAGIQPVRAVERIILEKYAIQVHLHQRTATHLRGPQQAQVDAHREVLVGRHVQAGDRDGSLAAGRHLLRGHQQRHAAHAVGAGVVQRKGHIQIQHHGAAALADVRFAQVVEISVKGESGGRLIFTELSSGVSCAHSAAAAATNRIANLLDIQVIDRYVAGVGIHVTGLHGSLRSRRIRHIAGARLQQTQSLPALIQFDPVGGGPQDGALAWPSPAARAAWAAAGPNPPSPAPSRWRKPPAHAR
jgi:hypothetical protein